MFGLTPFEIVLYTLPIMLPNMWSINHVFRCQYPTPQEKMVWIALTVFVPVLGGIIYIIWGRKRGQKQW